MSFLFICAESKLFVADGKDRINPKPPNITKVPASSGTEHSVLPFVRVFVSWCSACSPSTPSSTCADVDEPVTSAGPCQVLSADDGGGQRATAADDGDQSRQR